MKSHGLMFRAEMVRAILFDRYWRVRKWLPERYGRPCRIVKRGKMNSCMIEFEDGYRTITSRWNVRLIKRSGQSVGV